jgi:putative transposase
MHAYLGGVIKTLNCNPMKIGGVSDHVHLLTAFSRTLTIADFVKEVKRVSTNWANSNHAISGFHWQAGYAAFSVGRSETKTIHEYIDRQETHHHKVSFKDECRRLFTDHGIEFDKKYVWD